MQMIERKTTRRFIEEKDLNYRYRSLWLPDCILHPKLICICRFRAPSSSNRII